MTSMHPVCLSDQSSPDHHPLDLAHATLCKNFAQSKEFNGMLVKQCLCWYVCMYADGQVDNSAATHFVGRWRHDNMLDNACLVIYYSVSADYQPTVYSVIRKLKSS